MSESISLVGDIGGTNARFALVRDGEIEHFASETLATAEFDRVELAIRLFLEKQSVDRVQRIALAAAGPVINGQIKMTNTEWVINQENLPQEFSASETRVLNDIEAISLSLPHLTSGHLDCVGGNHQLATDQNYVLGVVGPGSGTGVGGLVGVQGKTHAIVCEGGHTGFAPENPYQLEILRYLQRHFSRVSNERILCGPGLVNLYQAICEIDGAAAEPLKASQIGDRAVEGSCDLCLKSMRVFFEILGQFAGDLALTINCREGLFIAGGISGRYPGLLQEGHFRSGFERKGRFEKILRDIPSWLITHPNPGLLGAAASLRQF